MGKAFRYITIDRLYLALIDLLGKRVTPLRSFRYGAYLEPELIELRDAIFALPEAIRGKPQAAALAEADRGHDGFGAAAIRVLQGHLSAPDLSPAARDAAEKILEFIGTLDDLQATYDAEAKAAIDKRAKLAGMEGLLKLFPVADNKTLADWAESHIAAGETIGVLMSNRADAQTRALAGSLRNQGVGMLNTLRAQLVKARKKEPTLPESRDQELFARCDELEAAAEQAAADEKKAEEQRRAEDKAKKAETQAQKADELTTQAAELARRAHDAQKAADDAAKLAAAARKAADDAQAAADAPPPPPADPKKPA
jgi:hypothetical protein